MAQENAPWRAGTAWWVTGIQAAVLVVIGLYFLLAPASAGGLLLQLISLVLLIHSAMQIVANFRAGPGGASPYEMLQAGVGVTVGLLIFFRGLLVPTLDGNSARIILSLGLLAYAIVGLTSVLLERGEGDAWMSPVLSAVLVIILALVLLTSSDSNAMDRLSLVGWIAVIGGVVLLVVAWMAHKRQTA
jgi:uncharacterized membrane protein HdeD (DUF308 family)